MVTEVNLDLLLAEWPLSARAVKRHVRGSAAG